MTNGRRDAPMEEEEEATFAGQGASPQRLGRREKERQGTLHAPMSWRRLRKKGGYAKQGRGPVPHGGGGGKGELVGIEGMKKVREDWGWGWKGSFAMEVGGEGGHY